MADDKERRSNLELLRIIMMFLIIAHHYVVNSGVEGLFDYSNPNSKMIFLKCFGLFGKTAINCFVLITGYFMCEKTLKATKVLKLYLEVKFYQIIMYIIMVLSGYIIFSYKDMLHNLFAVLRSSNSGFVSAFLAIYIMIPFINILIKNINHKEHLIIITFMILLYTIPRSFLHGGTYSHIGWYFNVYMIGSYIKKYPQNWMKKTWLSALIASGSFVLIIAITVCNILNGSTMFFWLICESCDLFAIILGVFMFLLFNNIKLPYIKPINVIAKTTFGVLMLHTANDGVRFLLWKKIFVVSGYYLYFSLRKLILYSFYSVIVIYIVCVVIDIIRIYIIEKTIINIIVSKFHQP